MTVRPTGSQPHFGAGESCEREVIAQLIEMQRRAAEHAKRDGLLAEDEDFYAEQNAVVVKNAERYYREMFGGRVSSWNLRDRHMAGTLEALAEHLGRVRGEPAKIVVRAHNSHLGDARATLADLLREAPCPVVVCGMAQPPGR